MIGTRRFRRDAEIVRLHFPHFHGAVKMFKVISISTPESHREAKHDRLPLKYISSIAVWAFRKQFSHLHVGSGRRPLAASFRSYRHTLPQMHTGMRCAEAAWGWCVNDCTDVV